MLLVPDWRHVSLSHASFRGRTTLTFTPVADSGRFQRIPGRITAPHITFVSTIAAPARVIAFRLVEVCRPLGPMPRFVSSRPMIDARLSVVVHVPAPWTESSLKLD